MRFFSSIVPILIGLNSLVSGFLITSTPLYLDYG
jgi:hypothetical protein